MDDRREEQRDLFDDLCRQTGCHYISDMDSRRGLSDAVKRAREHIAAMTLSLYGVTQLRDAAQYLYDDEVSFQNMQEAGRYFKEKLHASETR